jgi:hypothetical protein
MSFLGCSCGVCPLCAGNRSTTVTDVRQSIEKAERALRQCARVHNERTFEAMRVFQTNTALISSYIANLTTLLTGTNKQPASRMYFALSTVNKPLTPCAVATLDRREFSLTLMDSFVARTFDFCDLRQIAQSALSSVIGEISIVDIRGPLILVECPKLKDAVWVLIDYVTRTTVATSHTVCGFMGVIDPVRRMINSKLPARFFPDAVYLQGTVRRGKFLIQIQNDTAVVHDTISDSMTQIYFPEYKITLHTSIDYELKDGKESLIFRGNDMERVRRFRVPYSDISN